MLTPRTFHATYREAFEGFLARRGEPDLRTAYELGRDAVASDVSVLDLAVAHHDALADALQAAEHPARVAAAAGEFFLEALSAYEMVQRGIREARDTAVLNRRQTNLLRQLSNFLADGSLALGSSDSLEEMLQLVAEQARELMNAATCTVTLETTEGERIHAVATAQPDTWSRLLAAQITEAAPHSEAAADHPTAELSEALTMLDGRPIGAIVVTASEFSELDAAVLVQLAQMASAAVERRRLYDRP